ncbi:hypothetical protein [Tsukamurella soli]|uniref:ABC-2 type transport system permease protein n=1 Tax=Tsukamurella soli TaxID=644556 RepID=A0ABP8J0I7_9ACTN
MTADLSRSGNPLVRALRALWGQTVVEVRTLPRVWAGVVFNVVLAFAWLVIQPLDYGRTDRVSVIMTYFATFVLADSATTNMFCDLAPLSQGRLRLRSVAGAVLVRNVSLLLVIGVPMGVATGVLTWFLAPHRFLPISVAVVGLQVLIWMGLCSVSAALLPTVRRPLMDRWRHRRDWRETGWWIVGQTVPLAGIWVLVPVDADREVFPGVGFVHRHTPGGRDIATLQHGVAAVVDGAGLWLLGVAIATVLIWRFGLRLRG